jgi:isopenicillin N synthase-like dioxygenase
VLKELVRTKILTLITLLLGGHQRGLELLNKQGQWEKIAVNRDVIICNIGDMLQRFTNHYLPSTTHRVAKSGSDKTISRYSIPFFVHPNPDWQIKTLASCISESVQIVILNILWLKIFSSKEEEKSNSPSEN